MSSLNKSADHSYDIYKKDVSVWISASAGSGKTRTLIYRVISLIAQGCQNILCITFTNAAAEEILSRVVSSLRSLSSLNSKDLVEKMYIEYGLCFSENSIIDVHEHLSKGYDNIKVSTIHSLCAEINGVDEIMDENDVRYFLSIAFNKMERKISSFDFDVAPGTFKKAVYSLLFKWRKISYITGYNLEEMSEKLCQEVKRLIEPEHVDKPDFSKLPFEKEMQIDELKKKFLKKDGSLKKVNKDLSENIEIQKLQKWLLYIQEKENFEFTYKVTEFLIKFTEKVFLFYRDLKSEKKDYDDLIYDTLENSIELMRSVDSRLDHVLVDEAQDNTPEQWLLITNFVSDFFDGDCARECIRTIFVVGDIKQSIYGFCGVVPDIYQAMREYFRCKVSGCNQQWKEVELKKSYRTGKNILSFVDNVFSDIGGVFCVKNNKMNHIPTIQGGKVEIYPVPENVEEDGWQIRDVKHDKLQEQLAKSIALKISEWIENKREINGKAICSSDITVLVRKRSDFVIMLTEYLSEFGILSNNIGRFFLKEHRVVRLFIAIGRFIAEANLELGARLLMESPVFDHMSQKQIYSMLDRWSRIYGCAYNVYLDIVVCLQDSICRIFGYEAMYYVEKFVKLSSKRLSNMSVFIKWIDSEDDISDNNSYIPEEGVRIMTVHGAKGLESSIVFLIDDGVLPKSTDNLLFDDSSIPFFVRAEKAPLYCKEIKAKNIQSIYDEYLRLLYVALTRAKNELHICAWKQASSKVPLWYSLCSGALENDI